MDKTVWFGIVVTVAGVSFQYAVKSVPAYLAWPAVTTGIAIIALAASPERFRPPLPSSILYVVAVAAVTAALVYQLVKPQERTDPLDRTIDVACRTDQLPRAVPVEGGYDALHFYRAGDGSISLIPGRQTFAQPPGSTIDYGSLMPRALACQVKNYGQAPLYEVGIPVSVKVHSPEQVPGSSDQRAGAVVFTRDYVLPIGRLDEGVDRTRSIYITASHDFVELTIKGIVVARSAGAQKARTLRLSGAVDGRQQTFWLYPQQREPAEPIASAKKRQPRISRSDPSAGGLAR